MLNNTNKHTHIYMKFPSLLSQ